MNNQRFGNMIQEQVVLRSTRTDNAILEELEALPVLPDEDLGVGEFRVNNPVWSEPETRQHLLTYLALAQLVATRQLRSGVPLLLERASYGDMGETMRGLRHSLEAAYSPDWDLLTDVSMAATRSTHRGARLWAVRELGILRDQRALKVLLQSLYDPAPLVRSQAVLSLQMLAVSVPEVRKDVLDGLEWLLRDLQDTEFTVKGAIEKIQQAED